MLRNDYISVDYFIRDGEPKWKCQFDLHLQEVRLSDELSSEDHLLQFI